MECDFPLPPFSFCKITTAAALPQLSRREEKHWQQQVVHKSARAIKLTPGMPGPIEKAKQIWPQTV